MSDVFERYSEYYDLLYQDKDYESEASYVAALLERFGQNSQSILDLGCGTAKHALLFAEAGRQVIAIEKSETMAEEARCRVLAQNQLPGSVDVLTEDIRRIRLERH